MSDVVLTYGEITYFRPSLNTTLLSDISPHYFEQRPENNLVTNEQSKSDSNSPTRNKEGERMQVLQVGIFFFTD